MKLGNKIDLKQYSFKKRIINPTSFAQSFKLGFLESSRILRDSMNQIHMKVNDGNLYPAKSVKKG